MPRNRVPNAQDTLRARLEGPPSLSLEDVSGALAMRALGIRIVWAWDEDFRRLGFRVVP